jgi:hypothetical protein
VTHVFELENSRQHGEQIRTLFECWIDSTFKILTVIL